MTVAIIASKSAIIISIMMIVVALRPNDLSDKSSKLRDSNEDKDGPETSFGASNFIPSWMYWQKLPRNLQYPKTVILHRRENASWGFSIVGGSSDGNSHSTSHRITEPIHVLFVVPESPAAKDARLK